MIVRLLASTDAAWSRLLEQLSYDIYHLASYGDLFARELDGQARLLCTEGVHGPIVLPLIVRKIADQSGHWTFDAVTPYGYSGMLAAPGTSDEELAEFAKTTVAVLAEHGIVSVFIRSHPLLSPTLPAVSDLCIEEVQNGETVFVDLTQGSQVRRSQVRDGHSFDIRRMRRDGYTVSHNDWSEYGEFVKVYRDTMRRVGAEDGYFYHAQFFTDLRAALGDRLHLLIARGPDGSIAAGSLFSISCGIVQYLYSGTSLEHVKRGPSKLVLDEAFSWAEAEGAQTVHLGGGVGGRADSLFAFKAGFSNSRCKYNTLRWVISADGYSTLAGRQFDREELRAGFFPSYRAAASPQGAL